MSPALEARKSGLELALSEVIGEAVEITIRGPRAFTFSTERVVAELPVKLIEYFGARMHFESVEHDAEIGSFVYMGASA
jgi:hypothetical protein